MSEQPQRLEDLRRELRELQQRLDTGVLASTENTAIFSGEVTRALQIVTALVLSLEQRVEGLEGRA